MGLMSSTILALAGIVHRDPWLGTKLHSADCGLERWESGGIPRTASVLGSGRAGGPALDLGQVLRRGARPHLRRRLHAACEVSIGCVIPSACRPLPTVLHPLLTGGFVEPHSIRVVHLNKGGDDNDIVSSRCRFEEARSALTRALASRELFGAPLLVLANKQDAQDAQPPEEMQQGLGLDELKVHAVPNFLLLHGLTCHAYGGDRRCGWDCERALVERQGPTHRPKLSSFFGTKGFAKLVTVSVSPPLAHRAQNLDIRRPSVHFCRAWLPAWLPAGAVQGAGCVGPDGRGHSGGAAVARGRDTAQRQSRPAAATAHVATDHPRVWRSLQRAELTCASACGAEVCARRAEGMWASVTGGFFHMLRFLWDAILNLLKNAADQPPGLLQRTSVDRGFMRAVWTGLSATALGL